MPANKLTKVYEKLRLETAFHDVKSYGKSESHVSDASSIVRLASCDLGLIPTL